MFVAIIPVRNRNRNRDILLGSVGERHSTRTSISVELVDSLLLAINAIDLLFLHIKDHFQEDIATQQVVPIGLDIEVELC